VRLTGSAVLDTDPFSVETMAESSAEPKLGAFDSA
jgi:hypothetical protein